MTSPTFLIEKLRPKKVQSLIQAFKAQTWQNWVSFPNPSALRSAVYSLHPKAFCIFLFHMESLWYSTFWDLKTLTVIKEIPINHICISCKFLAYDHLLSPCSLKNRLNLQRDRSENFNILKVESILCYWRCHVWIIW